MAKYVLVADGGQARVLRTERSALTLTDILHLERPSLHKPARELTSDISGRSFRFAAAARGGRRRPTAVPHGTNSDFDPHAAEIARFAKRVARALDEFRRRGDMEQLIVIAEPRFLGLLRTALRPVIRRLVRREIARDLVHADVRRIRRSAFAR
ncbi:MAG: host attachment protein [Gammaproteobacteria bacterium]|nr:host attachment protein [Gammaproteobacteria bacterium]